MRRRSLAGLMRQRQRQVGRIFYHNIWFRTHNNRRYQELVPLLDGVDAFLIICSGNRFLRALQFRVLTTTRRARKRLVFSAAARPYAAAFVTDTDDVNYFKCPVVVDLDDPTYLAREVDLLNRQNVKLCVVTAPRAARKLEELGLTTPTAVIPQGCNLNSLNPMLTASIRSRYRDDEEVVVGYMAAWLLSAGDRGGDSPLYNCDHLIDLWERIRERSKSRCSLWLLGEPGPRLTQRVKGASDIKLFGRVAPDNILSYVTNFDLALYPRTADQGVQAMKIAEYIGGGVPIVAYDYSVTENVREHGCGVLVESPEAFVETVVALAASPSDRARLRLGAMAAQRRLDWRNLAGEYNKLLTTYLGSDAS